MPLSHSIKPLNMSSAPSSDGEMNSVITRHRSFDACQYIQDLPRETKTSDIQDDHQLSQSHGLLHWQRYSGIQDKWNWNTFHSIQICHGHILSSIPVFTITMIGHWSSNAFLHYICHQVQQFSFGVSNWMVSLPDLTLRAEKTPTFPDMFQYWPWCTACCTMTICIWPPPLSQRCCHTVWHWLHTCAQQSQVLEFGRMARWPILALNPSQHHQPQSLL
jgi:hypothetical protein